MTYLQIIFTYAFAMTRWALFGATGTYVLLLSVFSLVGHSEGIPFSFLPVQGFFFLCMCVGAFMGAASGVEVGQEAVYARVAAMKRARSLHPSVR